MEVVPVQASGTRYGVLAASEGASWSCGAELGPKIYAARREKGTREPKTAAERRMAQNQLHRCSTLNNSLLSWKPPIRGLLPSLSDIQEARRRARGARQRGGELANRRTRNILRPSPQDPAYSTARKSSLVLA